MAAWRQKEWAGPIAPWSRTVSGGAGGTPSWHGPIKPVSVGTPAWAAPSTWGPIKPTPRIQPPAAGGEEEAWEEEAAADDAAAEEELADEDAGYALEPVEEGVAAELEEEQAEEQEETAEDEVEEPVPAGLMPQGSGSSRLAGNAADPVQRTFIEQRQELSEEERETLEAQRALLEVSVEGTLGEAVEPIASFEELAVLPSYVTEALTANGITSPMPIQAQALPIILRGHDLIGIAKTGSGKTLSFLLPATVHIEAQRPLWKGEVTPIALVLAPTRELAVQISDEAEKILRNSKDGSNHPGGIRAAVVYGGKQKREQINNLWSGCHILVATPGRLNDLLSNEELSLSRVTYFVLDEADRMLDFGFQGDVNKIASSIREDRHMLFFSATWPEAVQDLARQLCHDEQQPVRISVGQHDDGVVATRADIVQQVVVFDQDTWEERDNAKQQCLYAYVREVLQAEEHKVLVFVSSKALADDMRNKLYEEGFMADSMHGGRSQQIRLDVLDAFRRGDVRLLVATDVMGRGLDIPDISHVVIYDMGDVEDYVHRIGRTARGLSGIGGHALTLFEYNHKWPELAGGLVQVLTEAGQEVPEELVKIADEVAAGERKTTERGYGAKEGNWKKRKAEWQSEWTENGTGWDKSEWNADKWNNNDGWKGGWQRSTW